MRSDWLVNFLLSVLVTGCGLTGPESCTSANTTIAARGIVRDSGGVELAKVTVIVQAVEGDTIPAWYQMVSESPGLFAPLANHVVAARLVGPAGETVYDITLIRRPAYSAESVMPLRDARVIANLESGLAHGTLTLVLTTDLRFGELRTSLPFYSAASGFHAPICYRTGGVFTR